MSYDYLEGDDVKSFFLLSGLLSNYSYVRDLLKYGMGLQLFEGTNTLEEARDRIDVLVERLQSSNLLLHTDQDKEIVKMHDVIRNIALEIASKEHHESTFQKGGWSKVNEELKKFIMRKADVSELPEGLVCPELELFMCSPNTQSIVEIPNTFFEGMKQLKVLNFTGMYLPFLPSSLECLSNLRTLCLDGWELGDIAIIAELKQLEILSLKYSSIEELPREIAQLTHLRLLDLKGSSKLKVIPPYVISSLTRLEDLCMGNSFTQWEMELGQSNTNACLAELNHLTLLSSLDIQIPDVKLLPEDINAFDNLVRYKIIVGDCWRWKKKYNTDRTVLKLDKLDTSLLHVVDGIRKLLERTEVLHLRGLHCGTNVVSRLNREGFLKLKHLIVESSVEIQYIVDSTDLITPSHGGFPVMETLYLNQLISLKQVLHGLFRAGSFSRLRKVEVEDCDGLKFLFTLSVVRGLSRLEQIKITKCKSMVEMVSPQGGSWQEEDIGDGDINNANVPLFPELKYLSLGDLPKLRHVCNWGSSTNDHFLSSSVASDIPAAGNIIFPKLSHMSLYSLRALTSFFAPGDHSVQRLHHAELHAPLPLLFAETVAFPCLEFLDIWGLDNVKKIWDNQLPQDSFSKLKEVRVASCGEVLNIFPASMLKRLQTLRYLKVEYCSSLQEVFDVEGMNVNAKEGVTVSQLNQLILKSLPKVEKIWNKDPHGILSFQNLKLVTIYKCQSLKNLFPASLVRDLVELQKLLVQDSGIEEIVAKDINNGVETEAATFVFSKLTSLKLYNLHQLRSLYSGPHTSHWPLLEFLEVRDCCKVNVFAFKSPTFQQRNHEGNPLMPLFLIQHVAFPCLEGVELGHNSDTEIWQGQFSVDSFPRLRVVDVEGYGNILVVIPSFMLQALHNLEELHVDDCGSIEEVFQLEGFVEEHQSAKLLTQLRKIRLWNLPRLKHLWKVTNKLGPDMQSLESLEVWNCERSINLVPPPSTPFQNLATLDVSSCGSLRSLISPSVAKTLVKLKTLKARGSYMMEEVVSNEGNLKEAADDDDEIITFCKLQHILLLDLPNLTSFMSSSGYILSFPSLEYMEVINCPKMKIFSPGLLTTPQLESVKVSGNRQHGQDDLNTTIQSLVHYL